MKETEAHSLFRMRTGRAADWVDFRNMLDEETGLVMRMALDMKQRLSEDKARETAVENLIGWCIEGPGIGFGKTMTSLAAFVASHRRPAIWAALLGSIRHVLVGPGKDGQDGRDGTNGTDRTDGGKDGQHGQDGRDGQDGQGGGKGD